MRQLLSDASSHREPGRRARLAAVGLLSALALAGCGASSVANPNANTKLAKSTAGTASRPVPQAAVPASVVAQEKALHAKVLSALHGAPPPGTDTPGIPKYLQGKTSWVQTKVTATLAKPRLAIAGDTLLAVVPGARAKLTVIGPIGEAKYAGTRLPAIPGRFTMKISGVQGSFPLAPADFQLVDVMGERLVPTITLPSGGKLPDRVTPGQSITVDIASMIPVGDGALIFSAPAGARKVHHNLAGWDFVVEDD